MKHWPKSCQQISFSRNWECCLKSRWKDKVSSFSNIDAPPPFRARQNFWKRVPIFIPSAIGFRCVVVYIEIWRELYQQQVYPRGTFQLGTEGRRWVRHELSNLTFLHFCIFHPTFSYGNKLWYKIINKHYIASLPPGDFSTRDGGVDMSKTWTFKFDFFTFQHLSSNFLFQKQTLIQYS